MAYDRVTESLRKKKKYVKGQSLNDFVKASIAENPILSTGMLQEKEQLTYGDIAPIVGSDEDATYFKKPAAFDDGYQFGDIWKTVAGTSKNIEENIFAGILGMGEAAVDAGAFAVGAVGGLFSDDFKERTKEFIAKDLYDEKAVAEKIVGWRNPTAFWVDSDDSILGKKAEGILQSGGQLLGTVALQAAGIPWFVTTGVTSFGGEVDNAFDQDATYTEAGLSGLITAGAEILTEKISGGIKFGGSTLDDALTKKIATGVSNRVVRSALKLGIDVAGEGGEEVLSGLMGAIGQMITYADNKELTELFSKEDALDAFIGGAALGGVGSGFNTMNSAIRHRDSTTGLTANEEAVFKHEYEQRVADAEKGGQKLNAREKNKVYNQVMEELTSGYLDTDTIESALGGETAKAYTDAVANEKSIIKQAKAMRAEFNKLNQMKTGEMTGEQIDRREELRGKLKEIEPQLKEASEKTQSNAAKTKLSEEVQKMLTETDPKSGKVVRSDNYLIESYNERAKRGQKFEADLSKYDEKQRKVVQSAIDSGVLNNTRRTHEMVDLFAKVASRTGINIDFTTTERIKQSGFAVDGRIVNGYITSDGIAVNINSPKALNFIVGHELTHVIEKMGSYYKGMQEALINYAKSKNDYNWRVKSLQKTYKGVKADISKELTADLVGDYIFSDKDFVNNLAKNHRNVFDKLFDEIKRLWKLATAGSKEKRQLEKAKNLFEDAIRENAKANESGEDTKGEDLAKKNEIGTAKYSISTTEDGIKYVRLDGNIFLKSDGSEMSPREAYNSLIGQKITLEDGDTITFVKKIPNIDLYKELFKKFPGYDEGLDVKAISETINKNMVEVVTASNIETRNEPQIHEHVGVKDFDIREVYITDGNEVYKLKLSIANLTDNTKIGYAKRYISRANEEISEKIKKAETRGKTPVNQPFDGNNQNQMDVSKHIIPQNSQKSSGSAKFTPSEFDGQYSLGDGREVDVVNGIAVAPNVAEAMKSDEYAPPADYMEYSLSTTPEWEKSYLEKNKDENAISVVKAIRNFNDKMVQNDAIRGYIPMGEYKYSKMGPLRSNQEYIVSFDMDTSCPRTFQFLNFRDAIQRKAGRYLSYNESINLLELMRAYGQQIPCCYCYVENKRVLLSASYNNFFGFRNAVMNAKTTADAEKVMYGYSDKKGLPDASRKALNRWRSDLSYNPSLTEVWTATNTARNSVLNYLDAQMEAGAINGKTAETKLNRMVLEKFGVKDKGAIVEIESFVKDWTYDTLANIPHIYNTDNDTSVSNVDERALALNHEALAYSKSASSAKNVDNYVPYTDQLKNISKEDREFIMGMGGIRKHSSNDFRMDYVQDYFLFYADLAADGWTGHTYTKSADFVKIFACTNDRINMSVAFYEDADGTIRENIDEGAAWRDVRELRKAHKNVGAMAMVTSDNQLSFALNSDWIDMIIPFHASGLDKAVWYNLRMWNDYTSKQGERFYNSDTMKQKLAAAGIEVPKGANAATVKALFEQNFQTKHIYGKDGEVLKPHFFPGDTYVNGQLVPGHHNNVETYFKLCEEYGVHPRFYGITVTDTNGNQIDVTEHPSYLKLIKETARTDSAQETIQFNFGNYDPYLKMTPFEYAVKRLEEEGKNGGFANTKEDPYGVVDEFIKEYLGKDRPLGYLTDRAKETREILLEMSKKKEAEQTRIVADEVDAMSLSRPNEPRRSNGGWQIYGEDVRYQPTAQEDLAPTQTPTVQADIAPVQTASSTVAPAEKKDDTAPVAPVQTPAAPSVNANVDNVNAGVDNKEDIAPVAVRTNPNALSNLKAPANNSNKTVEELQQEYGTIPQGEHPVRDDSLPKSTTGKDKVSQTARTVKGAKATPDDLADLLDKETAGGRLSYVPITNSETVDKAYANIVKKGWEAARGEWETRVRRGEVSAELTATGGLLLNNAAKAGDTKAWLDILRNYQLMGSNAGQAIQAMKILKTLTPSDSLYMIERSVEQMVEDMKLDTEIVIDETLKKAYLEAKTDAEKDAARKALAEDVASQIPATAMEKWTAIRYLNMLGNFKTQGKNVLGNVGMAVTSRLKNTIAASIEVIAEKASGGKFQRTKSILVNKDLLKAAREDFANVKHIALNGGKFNDAQAGRNQFQQEVQDARTIFKTGVLEKYRKKTNWAIDKGDLVFSRDAYARSLAGYLKANGIKETDFSKIDQKTLDKAREYAVNEAQENTFRDNNWLSDWISKIGRRPDTPKVGKLLSEGIMPFRKTPANILYRAEEYSPLGIINATVNSIKLAKGNENVTGADVVNSWAKALTGTGLLALGMLLNNAGALAGGADEDEDKDWFESMYGWQNYAIQIGDYNFTIDFLSPSAMPLLMGAQLNELRQDGGIELKDLESALLSIADPMIEMSMLQGVNDTLDNIRYSENNMGQFLINACLSYLTQGITNSFLGQLERSFEGQRMTTFVDKDSAVPAWLQKALGKASAKTPGWDYNQIPYVDAWGETEDIAPVGGLLENTLSPSYISEGFTDEVYDELNRLNEVQSDINVYPQTPDKTITFEDANGKLHEDYNLSAEEYEKLAKLQGQTQKALVEQIISSDVYAELTDAEKAKAIQLAYKYAKEYGRQEVLGSNGFSTKWMSEAGDNIVDAIIAHTSEERTFASEYPGRYAIAKSVGGYDKYRAYSSDLSKISGKQNAADYINGLDADFGEKIILWKAKYKSDNSYNHDIIDYLNSRDDLSYEDIANILTELGFTVHSNGKVTW